MSRRSFYLVQPALKYSRSLTSANFGPKSRVTGAGPFVELPQMSAIGNPGNLLAVQLPQDSPLNIRDNPIVISQTRSASFNGELKVLAGTTWFQRFWSDYPNTLLFSSEGSAATNRIPLDSDGRSIWKIRDQSSLSSWAGFDLSFRATDDFMEISGKGVFILSIEGGSTKIQLDENEELIVSKPFFKATNGSLQKLDQSNLKFTDEKTFSNASWKFFKKRLDLSYLSMRSFLDEWSQQRLSNSPTLKSFDLKRRHLVAKMFPRRVATLKYKITGPGTLLLKNTV